MRVIGGTYRGRLLKRVEKETTRETSDMVKVAVFNMLNLSSGTVLDLYAGAGSYGIEALSRGANFVHFVDLDKDAIQTIILNLGRLNLTQQSKVHHKKDERFLNSLTDERFDYVFLDPPYSHEIYSDVMTKLINFLNPQAKIICESKKSLDIQDVEGYDCIKDKTYGIKRIRIYEKK